MLVAHEDFLIVLSFQPIRPIPGFQTLENPMRIVHLQLDWPDENHLQSVAAKYCEFRLRSLKLAPDAYASTYDQECQFKAEVWRQRLTNPQARHIIVVNISADDFGKHRLEVNSEFEVSSLLEHEWLGMVVVVESTAISTGSEPKSSWELNQATAVSIDNHVPRIPHRGYSYQLNGLFVCPSVRRQGLGEALVKDGIETARTMAKQHRLSHADLSIMLDVWNKPAQALYSRNGFVDFSEQDFNVGGSCRKALTMVCTFGVVES